MTHARRSGLGCRSNLRHFPDTRAKDSSLGIDGVYQIEAYGLVVTFTDGTYSRYVVEELLELRPHRENVEEG